MGGCTSNPSYTRAFSRPIDPFDRPRAGQRFVLSINGMPWYKTETGSGPSGRFFLALVRRLGVWNGFRDERFTESVFRLDIEGILWM